MPESTDQIITGRAFKFEIDGKEIPLISCEPGAMTVELKDATMGNRADNYKDFTVTKPKFGTWRIEAYYSQGQEHLKQLFQAFATGQRKTNPSDAGSLVYLGRDSSPARRVDFFGFTPLHYESINLDSRNAGQAASEVMEFSVLRCAYGMG